jgi:hypothetical protein
VSARDRAFSRLDRADLQEVLSSGADSDGVGNARATKYRIAREQKLLYLDELFSDLDISGLHSALNLALLAHPRGGEPLHPACENLSAGLVALGMLYEKPQNVKVVAPKIKALIIDGYAQLVDLGFSIPADNKE